MARYVADNLVPLALSLAVHVAAGQFFLRRAGVTTKPGMPLDDAWIHFAFARNLATHGQLAFNIGQPSAGTTSLLWVFSLAIGYRLIGDMVVAAWILGIGASLLATIAVFELAKRVFRDRDHPKQWALLVALGYASSGVVVWHQLSGMETLLFLALGLWAILAYHRRRLALTGLLLGLLILTRIEGVVLLVSIVIIEVERHRSSLSTPGKPLLALVALPAVLNLPALYFLYQTTGNLLPTTLAGRRWLIGLERSLWVLDPVKSFLEFPMRWVYYVYAYLFMGVRASGLPLTVVLSAFGRTRPVNLLYLGLIGGLLLLGSVFFLHKLVQVKAWRSESSLAGVGLFAGWTVLHNLVYSVFLPWTGHAGRYQIMNFLLVWLLVGASLSGLRDIAYARRPGSVRMVRIALSSSLFLLLVMNILGLKLWAGYYAHGVQRINSLHVQAGRWMDQHLPEDARPAAFDIGAIGYFARQNLVDLSGLTNEDYLDFLYTDRVVEYLALEGVTHVALTEFDRPGDGGYNDILGIYREQGKRYSLVPFQDYHVAYTDDALATSNAGSWMRIFQLRWLGANSTGTIKP